MTALPATLTSTSSRRRPAIASPTAVDRALLGLSGILEAAAVSRMQRRAAGQPSGDARDMAADRRRDAAASVHAGLLPR
jgi:hypothetical protein